MINHLELIRNDLLLLLPEGTDEQFKGEGLQVNTLKSQTYNPVYGHVMQRGPECKHVQVGDKAFFQVFAFSTGKERAYGNEDKDFALEYNPATNLAFKENGHWYMVIREDSLYCVWKAGGTGPLMLNGFIVGKPLYKLEDGKLIEAKPHYHKADWEQNCCKNWYSDSDYGGVDILYTERFCQTTLEEKYNYPFLDYPLFIIESKNITAMEIDGKYEAGRERVIVEPDEIEQETEGGLIDTSKGSERLLTGKVISIGKGASDWGEGSTVLYARNSGMPIAGTNYLVLNDRDVFAKIKS